MSEQLDGTGDGDRGLAAEPLSQPVAEADYGLHPREELGLLVTEPEQPRRGEEQCQAAPGAVVQRRTRRLVHHPGVHDSSGINVGTDVKGLAGGVQKGAGKPLPGGGDRADILRSTGGGGEDLAHRSAGGVPENRGVPAATDQRHVLDMGSRHRGPSDAESLPVDEGGAQELIALACLATEVFTGRFVVTGADAGPGIRPRR